MRRGQREGLWLWAADGCTGIKLPVSFAKRPKDLQDPTWIVWRFALNRILEP